MGSTGLSCFPTLPVGLLSSPQAPAEVWDEKGIFGRFWYHSLSSTKRKAGVSRRQDRAERPVLRHSSACRTLEGTLHFWAPRR